MAKASLPNSISPFKICNHCKTPKELVAFCVNRARPHGRNDVCRQCINDENRRPFGYSQPFEVRLQYDAMRFWALVEPSENGCFMWQGKQSGDHYGRFSSRAFNLRMRAHRFAWQLARGGRLTPEQVICHACDTPLCVNPNHLWVGTLSDNTRDMWQKGRSNVTVLRGERQGRAKLKEVDVLAIRKRYEQGERYSDLARHFAVTSTTIYQIVLRKLWRHI